MKNVTIREAETNLSKLIEMARRGEEIVISRESRPVVRLVAVTNAKGQRQPGSLKGKFRVGRKFFEPLSAEELTTWE